MMMSPARSAGFTAQGRLAVCEVNMVWPLLEERKERECNAKTNSPEQKDKEEQTSGTNQI